MKPSDNTKNFNKQTLQLIKRYMLNVKNPFHFKAAQKIVQQFQPEKDKDFEIKLLSRMKVSLGPEVNLHRRLLLLPRREPVYLNGVTTNEKTLIMYGVDRMSNKDMNSFIFEQTMDEQQKKPSNEPLVEKPVDEKVTNECKKNKHIELTRLDTSHYGIIILDEQGKQALKRLFLNQKQSIFNVLKQQESQAEGDQQKKKSRDTKKIPRGWFSTKPYENHELCIRYATSDEYVNNQWTIITKALQQDLICRVNIFANTLESQANLKEQLGIISEMNSKLIASRNVSLDFKSNKSRTIERSRSRQKYQFQNNQSPLNVDTQKSSFVRVCQQIFGQNNKQKQKIAPQKEVPQKKVRNIKQDEDELSQILSKMSCEDNNKAVDIQEPQKQKQVDALAENKDSAMVEQGEMNLNEMSILNTSQIIKATAPVRVMVEQSEQSNHLNQDAEPEAKQKLVNSFKGLGAKDTLTIHPDIYKNKRIQKYLVNPSKKFNYTKYNEERQLEAEIQRRKAKLKRRSRRNPNKVILPQQEQQNIAIVNLISDDDGPIVRLGKKNSSTSMNEEQEFVMMDNQIIPQCNEIPPPIVRARQRIQKVREAPKKIIVHYQKSPCARSSSPKSRKSSFQNNPKPKNNQTNKPKSRGSSHSKSPASKKGAANSSKGRCLSRSKSPASKKNQEQGTNRNSSPFLFVQRPQHNEQQKDRQNSFNKPYEQRQSQNRYSNNNREDRFDSRGGRGGRGDRGGRGGRFNEGGRQDRFGQGNQGDRGRFGEGGRGGRGGRFGQGDQGDRGGRFGQGGRGRGRGGRFEQRGDSRPDFRRGNGQRNFQQRENQNDGNGYNQQRNFNRNRDDDNQEGMSKTMKAEQPIVDMDY